MCYINPYRTVSELPGAKSDMSKNSLVSCSTNPANAPTLVLPLLIVKQNWKPCHISVRPSNREYCWQKHAPVSSISSPKDSVRLGVGVDASEYQPASSHRAMNLW